MAPHLDPSISADGIALPYHNLPAAFASPSKVQNGTSNYEPQVCWAWEFGLKESVVAALDQSRERDFNNFVTDGTALVKSPWQGTGLMSWATRSAALLQQGGDPLAFKRGAFGHDKTGVTLLDEEGPWARVFDLGRVLHVVKYAIGAEWRRNADYHLRPEFVVIPADSFSENRFCVRRTFGDVIPQI